LKGTVVLFWYFFEVAHLMDFVRSLQDALSICSPYSAMETVVPQLGLPLVLYGLMLAVQTFGHAIVTYQIAYSCYSAGKGNNKVRKGCITMFVVSLWEYKKQR
jgi:hypothetical protein